MATWEYISKRRGYVLEEFVRGASTLEEAMQIFRVKDVPVPQDGSLEALFSKDPVSEWGVVDGEPSKSAEAPEPREENPPEVKEKASKKKKVKKKAAKDWGIVDSKESVD